MFKTEPLEVMHSHIHRLIIYLLMVAIGWAGENAKAAPPLVLTLSAKANGSEIQSALDNLPSGGEVLLSSGTYEISQPLLLRHNDIALRGSGLSTVLHLANHANCPVVILAPPMTQVKSPATHLLLADLLIDGNRQNQKVEFWKSAGDGSEINNNGIQIWNVNDATVDHVTCCRCRSGGLVTASVRRLQVSGFDSYDNQFDGLACYETEDSHFTNLHLHDNLGAGISLDLAFNHNFFTNSVLAGNDLGIFMRHSCNNVFQALTISKSHHHGVFMAQATVGRRLCPDTQCVGNDFQNLMVSDCGGKAFQVNDASCVNNEISGAKFIHNQGGLGQPTNQTLRVRELAQW